MRARSISQSRVAPGRAADPPASHPPPSRHRLRQRPAPGRGARRCGWRGRGAAGDGRQRPAPGRRPRRRRRRRRGSGRRARVAVRAGGRAARQAFTLAPRHFAPLNEPAAARIYISPPPQGEACPSLGPGGGRARPGGSNWRRERRCGRPRRAVSGAPQRRDGGRPGAGAGRRQQDGTDRKARWLGQRGEEEQPRRGPRQRAGGDGRARRARRVGQARDAGP
jgi:hypothetical protein